MSGQCYSCATGFSLFKKELGCKNCGFAFCKNCLKYNVAVPKLNNEKHKVCLSCYNILTGKTKPKPQGRISPPQNFKKRLAALEDPGAARPVPSSGTVPPARPARDAAKYDNPADQDIARRLGKLQEDRAAASPKVPSQKEMEERLAKLKEKDGPPAPSATEMSERLAKLKGQDPATANKPHVFVSDRRLPSQQVDDLLAEICDEVEIDARHDPVADVQGRLDHLRGVPGPKPPSERAPAPSLPRGEGEEEGEFQAMQRLVEEVAEELALDAERAVQGLQKDKEIWARLQKLKEKGDKKEGAEKEGTEKEGAEGKTKKKDEFQPKASAEGVQDQSGKSSEFNSPEMAADTEELDEDDDEAAKELIRKLLIESALEDAEEKELIGDAKADSEELTENDEFPWCILCNEDATLQCMGCDGDLYCKTCYRKGHDRFELQDHTTKPFKPRKPAKS